MKVIVHRGSHEIGGICISLVSETGGTLLIDAGKPLTADPSAQDKDAVRFAETIDKILSDGALDGVLFSHGHMDHVGFEYLVPAGIPRFVGATTLELLRLRQEAGIGKFEDGREGNWADFRTYQSGKTFYAGNFAVTPWLMDHSAMDAYAFEIEADGQRIVFSGDFRAHGRKSILLDRFLECARHEPDLLLLEGTTVNRAESDAPETESMLENRLVDLCRTTAGIVFVQCSAENIDRIVGLYRSCKRSGRTLVVDLYTALILHRISAFHPRLPCPGGAGWEQLRVWYPQPLTQKLVISLGPEDTVFRFRKVQIKRADFHHSGPLMMMVRPTMQCELAHWLGTPGDHAFVYSLWKGYLHDDKQAAFIDFMAGMGAGFHYVHTSGHADPATLLRVIKCLAPLTIIPVHTASPELFSNYSPLVQMVADGESVAVCHKNAG